MRNLLFPPFLGYVTRPVNNLIVVLIGDLKPVHPVLTGSDGDRLCPQVLVDVKVDWTDCFARGSEDR